MQDCVSAEEELRAHELRVDGYRLTRFMLAHTNDPEWRVVPERKDSPLTYGQHAVELARSGDLRICDDQSSVTYYNHGVDQACASFLVEVEVNALCLWAYNSASDQCIVFPASE